MITVYGKKGCAKCKAAMDKLSLMGLPFEYVDIAEVGVHRHHPKAVDALAESAMRGEQWPMILADDRWMEYPEAMAYYKGK